MQSNLNSFQSDEVIISDQMSIRAHKEAAVNLPFNKINTDNNA